MCHSDAVTGFEMSTSREQDMTVLRVVGELDMRTAPRLGARATTELSAPECQHLVLDLGELTFVDSSGLGCWIEIRRQAQSTHHQFTIRSVTPAVLRVLEISGLDTLFLADN
jgi:stage II sporulation protein AA (anti-sigma F factor antagonist)